MKRLLILLPLALLSHAPLTGAQPLYKCTTPQGGIEYRNSPCESGQKSAGAVQQGSVSRLPAAPAPAPDAPAADKTVAPFSLDKFTQVFKNFRQDSAPIDTVAAGECRAGGGHYVQDAGCLDAPPSNRNPAIGETKMREICTKLGKTYIKVLNDCVVKR